MTESFAEKAAAKLKPSISDIEKALTDGTPMSIEPDGRVIINPPQHKLGVFRLDKRAKMPMRAHASDVGYDLFAHILTEAGRDSTRMIPRFGASAIPTGLVVRPPPGYYCQVCSRSGWALQSVFAANSPGIMDPEYVGELQVILYNGSHETKWISHGQRIGQLVLAPIIPSELFEITDPPSITGRGTSGFGSTGF